MLKLIGNENKGSEMDNFVSKRILVVDDEEELRDNIGKLLSIMGFVVDKAEDGEKAFNLICSNDYDLIISDVKMPVMDGNELLEKVRLHPDKKFAQFIFLTSNIELTDIRSGMLLGADDYVTKPFDNKVLIQTVKKRLERSGSLNEYYKNKFESVLKGLEDRAYYQQSTRLPNNIAFNDKVNGYIKSNIHFGFFYICIDGVEEITSFLSLASYNNLINTIAKELTNVLSPDEEVYYLDDIAFGIIFKSDQLISGSELLNSRIDFYKSAIRQPVKSGDIEFLFDSSAGIFVAHEFPDYLNAEEILRDARIALLFSRKASGGVYTVYSDFIRRKFSELSMDFIKKHKSVQKKQESFEDSLHDNFETKIFFLYPQSIIQSQLIQKITYNEYSAYVVNDHTIVEALLKRYSNSILFVNIDAILKPEQWEEYIADLKNNSELEGVRIGVLTHRIDDANAERYLMQIMIDCGFIQLKTGFDESFRVILKVLEANEAKGKRKYIRLKVESKVNTFAEFKINERYFKAVIHDISSVAMTVSFEDQNISLEQSEIDYIMLHLSGVSIHLKGKLIGSRVIDPKILYVISFVTNNEERDKVKNYIYRKKQEYLDNEIREIKKNM